MVGGGRVLHFGRRLRGFFVTVSMGGGASGECRASGDRGGGDSAGGVSLFRRGGSARGEARRLGTRLHVMVYSCVFSVSGVRGYSSRGSSSRYFLWGCLCLNSFMASVFDAASMVMVTYLVSRLDQYSNSCFKDAPLVGPYTAGRGFRFSVGGRHLPGVDAVARVGGVCSSLLFVGSYVGKRGAHGYCCFSKVPR